MSNVIGIVNYGVAGNIHSIEKAIKKAGGKVLIIKSVGSKNISFSSLKSNIF